MLRKIIIRVKHERQDGEYFMRDLVTFYLTIKYRSPSKERSFLGREWGIRDVRGPYLDGFIGRIHVASTVLSSETSSAISLVLSASNRCPSPSVLVKVSTNEEEISKTIERNGSADFIFNSIYAKSTCSVEFLVQLPDVRTPADLEKFWTVLAIDELTIERLQ